MRSKSKFLHAMVMSQFSISKEQQNILYYIDQLVCGVTSFLWA